MPVTLMQNAFDSIVNRWRRCQNAAGHFVGSTDRTSSQQLQIWFSGHFFAPKLTAQFVTPIVSARVKQIWREKMSEKPHSFDF